ncbi:hypothetical protein [Pontibacter sp. H249]|uniref:hypothetical protein n=1 Tax=Pontibacter sp. H249 TaxID=3133420 RepID=UPI0030C369B5
MKKVLTLLLLLNSFVAHAQHSYSVSDKKAANVKAAMVKAMGGKKALKAINYFSYTILRTSYGTDTTTTRSSYTLNLRKQYIQEKQYVNGGAVTKWIGEDGAWAVENGIKTSLPQTEKQRLQRTFYTNFVPMLQNKELVYEHKYETVYKGRPVDIIRVYAPQKKDLIMDLFVDSDNGKILTSSKPDIKTGEYLYFADELDYQAVGKGVIFPLIYQVWVKGKLVSEGKFVDIEVKQ